MIGIICLLLQPFTDQKGRTQWFYFEIVARLDVNIIQERNSYEEFKKDYVNINLRYT